MNAMSNTNELHNEKQMNFRRLNSDQQENCYATKTEDGCWRLKLKKSNRLFRSMLIKHLCGTTWLRMAS